MGSSKKSAARLSDKQARFVEEYLVDLNAVAAAERAGYSKMTAQKQAFTLLANPVIQHAVERAKKARSARTEITADNVLRELACLAFSDLSEILQVDKYGRVLCRTLDDLPPPVRRCIESIKQVTTETPDGEGGVVERVQLSVKLHSKVSALTLLVKHLGLEAPQKVDVNAQVEVRSAKESLKEKLHGLRERIGDEEPGGAAGVGSEGAG